MGSNWDVLKFGGLFGDNLIEVGLNASPWFTQISSHDYLWIRKKSSWKTSIGSQMFRPHQLLFFCLNKTHYFATMDWLPTFWTSIVTKCSIFYLFPITRALFCIVSPSPLLFVFLFRTSHRERLCRRLDFWDLDKSRDLVSVKFFNITNNEFTMYLLLSREYMYFLIKHNSSL